MRSVPRAVAAALFILALASGCSSEPGRAIPTASGQHSTAPSQTRPTSEQGQQLPHSGAPTVTNPLPTSVLERDPCTVLTDSQIDQLFEGDPKAESGDSGLAHTCRWSDPASYSSVGVQLLYSQSFREGLSGLYERVKPDAEFWQELEPVQGYPVVAYLPVDTRDQGECAVVVGVADNMVFQIDSRVSEGKVGQVDPCEAARQVADMAVTTLKKGAN